MPPIDHWSTVPRTRVGGWVVPRAAAIPTVPGTQTLSSSYVLVTFLFHSSFFHLPSHSVTHSPSLLHSLLLVSNYDIEDADAS
jgi:hypothetical protein